MKLSKSPLHNHYIGTRQPVVVLFLNAEHQGRKLQLLDVTRPRNVPGSTAPKPNVLPTVLSAVMKVSFQKPSRLHSARYLQANY